MKVDKIKFNRFGNIIFGLFIDYPLSLLSTAVRDYLNEIFDTQSKLKAIALCRNGITNPNAGIENK